MEEKKNNKGIIWLITILIILVLGLIGYIVYDKVLTNNENNKDSEATNIKQENETDDIIYDLDEKMVSFKDLNLNILKDFKENYSINFNGVNKVLTIENKYTIENKIESEQKGTSIWDKNEITFYIDNVIVYKHTQTCEPIGCTKTINNIGVFNNKYLAISLLDTSSNGLLVDIEELHLFELDKEVTTINSLYYNNKNIELKDNYIYYYADENNTTNRNEKTNFYKYRKSILGESEKLDYLYNVDCFSGTEN